MPEEYRKEHINPDLSPQYDQFVLQFARKFEKKHEELFKKDPVEYWNRFMREKDDAWCKYKYNLDK